MATILIVDDCPDQLRLAGHLLKSNGDHQCLFADSVTKAFEQLLETLVDLVVTDLELPDADGLDLLDSLKSSQPHIPVMLMTGRGSEEIALEALRRGAASYVPKRQLREFLAEEVARVLECAQAARIRNHLARIRTACTEQFRLSNDRDIIPPLIKKLLQDIAEFDLCDEHHRMKIGVALEEALTNAMIHGNLEVSSELRGVDDEAFLRLITERAATEPYQSRRVKVMVSLDRHRAAIVIRDDGPGFDVEQVPDPTLPENMDRAHGRGLLLIRAFFDEVAHNERGNEIRLVFRKKACSIAPHTRPHQRAIA